MIHWKSEQRHEDGIVKRNGRLMSVTLFKPEHIVELMTDEDNFPMDPVLHITLAAITGQSILSVSGDEWAMLRKLLKPEFFNASNFRERFIPAVATESDRIVDLVGASDEPVDVLQAGEHMAFNVMGQVIFGHEFDGLKAKAYPEIKRLFSGYLQTRLKFSDLYSNYGETRWTLPMRANLLLYGAGIGLPFPVHSQKKIPADSVIKRTIIRRDFMGEGENDILSGMLVTDEKGAGLSYDQIYDNISALIAAGFFTTRNALAYCVQEILNHPDTLAKVIAEAEATADSETFENYDKTHPETTRALMESLRIHPPVQRLVRKALVTKAFGDVVVPEGASIFINIASMHMNPDIFPDPTAFNPDRFLERIPKGAYIPFGFGDHRCLGERVALMESVALIAKLFKTYEIEAVSQFTGHKPGLFMEPEGQLLLRTRPKLALAA